MATTRRTFLTALAYLASISPPTWAEAPGVAELLAGQPVKTVPPELAGDMKMLFQRLNGLDEGALQTALANWPEGEAAARRVILGLLQPWSSCPFANHPGHPPALRADWSRPWPG